MESALAAFIRAYGEKPWRPGVDVDCCLFLASWALWLGHTDPAAHLRGTYDNDDGFRLIVDHAGGVLPLVADCVGRIDGRRVQDPACGAIGVIGSPNNIHRQFGAIHDGERWLVRFKKSVGPMVAAPLAIWMI
ncbi:hypothetical protein N182_18635 [Sinorhizobium sp. GL2]|nr:hypothetical protein N182_18635 [Sinorhizobium sp. GL2]